MKIVVLDGFALNPGDLSWDSLAYSDRVTVYDRTPPELIVERAKGAEAVLTNKTPLSAAALSQLPELRYIGVLATGYNNIDVTAAKERGIVVANVPDYGSRSVAQFVFALLLELCHHVQLHSEAVHAGAWCRSPDFCFTRSPLVELAGKTMGIIGFGTIGRQTAGIAAAFGMKIMTIDRGKRDNRLPFGIHYADMNELLTEADVISLHCPLTPDTTGLVNRGFLARMKRSALLINTSRGGLVVEWDLADALHAGRIAGAGLDVLSMEPPEADHILLEAPNCIVTPHIAWATREARSRLLDTASHNLKAFLSGKPVNVVN